MRAGIGVAVVCAVACAWAGSAVASPASTDAPAKCVVTKKHHCPAKPKPKPKPKPKKTGGSGGGTTTKSTGPPPCGVWNQQYLVGEGLAAKGTSLSPTGTLRVLLLFVDFPDDPGTVSTQSVADTFASKVTQFYAANSYGKLNVQLTPTPNWSRMPMPSSAYTDTAKGGLVNDPVSYMHDAIAASDATVDFSKYDATLVVVPPNSAITRSEAGLYPTAWGLVADGAHVSFFAPLSSQIEQYPTYAWTVAVHELGHLLSLPDLYDVSSLDPNAEQTIAGGWDMMADSWEGHEFAAWDRYKLGWLYASQLGCLSGHGTMEQTVTPVETSGGVKALVVDLGSSYDIVAEVRGAIDFDQSLCHPGVLITRVWQLGVTGALPPFSPLAVQPAAPTDPGSVQSCGYLNNAAFGAGQTYTDAADGVTIQIESANPDGSYTIRATRS